MINASAPISLPQTDWIQSGAPIGCGVSALRSLRWRAEAAAAAGGGGGGAARMGARPVSAARLPEASSGLAQGVPGKDW